MNWIAHNLSDVQTTNIGLGTEIWQFVVILPNATIGKNCNINSHVFIENNVIIGNNVTVKCGVQLWDGITIEDNCFIGPNVTFTNDLVPRSKKYPSSFNRIIIKRGASIGANATIVGGNNISEYALIGAGSVITKAVGKNELWYGNPAKLQGYVTNDGIRLNLDLVSLKLGKKFEWYNNELIELK